MFCEGESASKLLGSTDHSSDFFGARPQIISSGSNLQATKISGNKKLFLRQKTFILQYMNDLLCLQMWSNS